MSWQFSETLQLVLSCILGNIDFSLPSWPALSGAWRRVGRRRRWISRSSSSTARCTTRSSRASSKPGVSSSMVGCITSLIRALHLWQVSYIKIQTRSKRDVLYGVGNDNINIGREFLNPTRLQGWNRRDQAGACGGKVGSEEQDGVWRTGQGKNPNCDSRC